MQTSIFEITKSRLLDCKRVCFAI